MTDDSDQGEHDQGLDIKRNSKPKPVPSAELLQWLTTSEGQDFLKIINEQFNTGAAFRPGDAEGTAFRAGQRAVALFLNELAGYDPHRRDPGAGDELERIIEQERKEQGNAGR